MSLGRIQPAQLALRLTHPSLPLGVVQEWYLDCSLRVQPQAFMHWLGVLPFRSDFKPGRVHMWHAPPGAWNKCPDRAPALPRARGGTAPAQVHDHRPPATLPIPGDAAHLPRRIPRGARLSARPKAPLETTGPKPVRCLRRCEVRW